MRESDHQNSHAEAGREGGREPRAKIFILGGKVTGRSADAAKGQQWNDRLVSWWPVLPKGFCF